MITGQKFRENDKKEAEKERSSRRADNIVIWWKRWTWKQGTQQKIENVRKCEDATVAEYEKILKNVRKNIIGIASRQGWTLGKFEESNIFVDLIKQLVISKSTMNL